MDPGFVAASAIGAATTSTATKGVDKVNEKYGMKGTLIISILALFQAVNTKSFRGILGWCYIACNASIAASAFESPSAFALFATELVF